MSCSLGAGEVAGVYGGESGREFSDIKVFHVKSNYSFAQRYISNSRATMGVPRYCPICARGGLFSNCPHCEANDLHRTHGKRSLYIMGPDPINHPGQSLLDALPITTQKPSEPFERNESSSGNPPKSRGVPIANVNYAPATVAPPPSKTKQSTSEATLRSPPPLRKDIPLPKRYAQSGGKSYTPPLSRKKCEAKMRPHKLGDPE